MVKLLRKIFLLSVLLPLLIIPVYAQETQNEIPSWIKVVAGAWYNDGITDSEYQNAMEFLIENSIINIKNPFIMSDVSEIEKVYLEQKAKDDMYITNLEKTNEGLRDRLEHFPSEETEDWYQQEMHQLYQQLGEIPELKSWAASLEEENENLGNNNRELHNKIIELEQKIIELSN